MAEDTAKMYCSSVVGTFLWFPYRDFVKSFTPSWPPQLPPAHFVLSRYRGMVENPTQLALLASSNAFLVGGFVAGGGGASGAVAGGFAYGASKAAMRTMAMRMKSTNRNGSARFSSVWEAVRVSTAEQGVWSWFAGTTAHGLISTALLGSVLVALSDGDGLREGNSDRKRRHRRTFMEDWWTAVRSHAFASFLTCPLRNTFRSALHPVERSGGVRSMKSFVDGERAIFREAAGVMSAMLRSQGLPFFVHGALRNMFKSSVPFGFTYALYRSVGGRF